MSPWASAFLFTTVVEVPIYAFALRDRPWAERLALGFLASALTHPIVWFVLPPVLRPHLGYVGYVLVAEIFAVTAEGQLLRGAKLRDPFLWALLANALSAGLGFASRGMFGWP